MNKLTRRSIFFLLLLFSGAFNYALAVHFLNLYQLDLPARAVILGVLWAATSAVLCIFGKK